MGEIGVLFETTNPVPNAAPTYNGAPTDTLPVVRLDREGRRSLDLLRWGLVPYWAKATAAPPLMRANIFKASTPIVCSALKVSVRCAICQSGRGAGGGALVVMAWPLISVRCSTHLTSKRRLPLA
jgi:putative SOS response-associated peptidase YedK